MSGYIEVNRANWDSRVPHHVVGYDLDSFRSDPAHLSHVVQFDLPRLGSIVDLDVVHCNATLGRTLSRWSDWELAASPDSTSHGLHLDAASSPCG